MQIHNNFRFAINFISCNNFSMELSQIIPQITNFISQNGWILFVIVVLAMIIFAIVKKTLKIATLSILVIPTTLLISRTYQFLFVQQLPFDQFLQKLFQWKILEIPNEYVMLLVASALVIVTEAKCFGIIISIATAIYAGIRYFTGASSLPDLLVPTIISIVSIFIAKFIIGRIK